MARRGWGYCKGQDSAHGRFAGNADSARPDCRGLTVQESALQIGGKPFLGHSIGKESVMTVPRSIIAAGLFLVVAVPPRPWARASDGSGTPLSAKVDGLFAKWDRHDSPGFAVGVIRHGKFVHRRGYGMANLDEGIRITSESVFDLYSVTKSFTTACIARLLDQGDVSLDDDIRKYVSELRQFKTPIKIRHLIRCRSGLRDYLDLMMLLGRERDDTWTDEDVLDVISRQKSPTFTPGEKHAYNNSDFLLLGLIIQRATGKPLREFADEQLFQPLGMKHTFFDDDRSLPLKYRAIGHGRYRDGRFHRLVMGSSTVGPWGLKTTVDDLLRWDRNFHKNKLPQGAFLDEFFTQGSLLGNENCLSSDANQKYKGLKRVWYTGGGPGFLAQFVRFPKHDCSIVLLGNLSEEREWHDMVRIIGQIADLHLADEISTVTARDRTWDNNAKAVELQALDIKDKVGGYQKPNGKFVQLKMKNGRLTFFDINHAFDSDKPFPLTPLSTTRFRSTTSLVPFDLLFERQAPEERFGIQVQYRDGRAAKWKRVEFVSPNAERLANYAGEFYCDDLESVYRFSVKGGALFVQFNYGRKKRLAPTVQDVFIPSGAKWDNMIFAFSRDDSRHISGFQLDFDRIKRLEFAKKMTRQSEPTDRSLQSR